MGMKGIFFSQEYLKNNFFSEHTRVGLMKSPSIVVVYRTLDLRSLPTQDCNIYISGILPILVEYALNWNIIPCLGYKVTLSGTI